MYEGSVDGKVRIEQMREFDSIGFRGQAEHLTVVPSNAQARPGWMTSIRGSSSRYKIWLPGRPPASLKVISTQDEPHHFA
jgi:hypothetical protein